MKVSRSFAANTLLALENIKSDLRKRGFYIYYDLTERKTILWSHKDEVVPVTELKEMASFIERTLQRVAYLWRASIDFVVNKPNKIGNLIIELSQLKSALESMSRDLQWLNEEHNFN